MTNEPANAGNVPKPEMNIVVSPQSGLFYGDKVSVTGTLTDEKNLKMYTILLKDGNDTELYRKEQMLLGQSFQMNDHSLSLFRKMQKKELLKWR